MKSDNPIPENPATERSGLLIRDLNADEKPREKANRFGMDALTDVELLALLLGSGVPGKSVLDLSREILQDNDPPAAAVAYVDCRVEKEIQRCRRSQSHPSCGCNGIWQPGPGKPFD